MSALHGLHRPLLALLFAACSAGTIAHAAAAQFEPQIGQEGKDVIWVPTPQTLVDKMLDMAKMTPNDYVIDLGSGDGRTVIAAARRGARALGIEYNPDMVELSKRNAEKEGVAGKASFMKADLFESDLSQATVITMYLLPQINLKLRPKILDLKPGTRIVSHAFTMDDWAPDDKATVSDSNSYNRNAYLWIVPAKVEGAWQMPQGELSFKQSFQTFTGTLKSGGNTTVITNGKLSGDRITFTAGNAEYSGRVTGTSIEGTVKGASAGSWFATRGGAPKN
jgi:SAM-dependent methyltransferase